MRANLKPSFWTGRIFAFLTRRMYNGFERCQWGG